MNFNSSRLKLARQRKGITQTALAELSGISLRSISNYERGKGYVSADQVEKLAEVLSVTTEFLTDEDLDQVPVEAVSFRKLSKTTARTRDAVLAEAALTVSFYRIVEQRFKLPRPQIPTLDKNSPEQAAMMVRRLWDLGDKPISNMLQLLELKGVRIASINYEHSSVDAFCFERDGVPYIFLNTSKTSERQRFDLAHELGHLVLHSESEMDQSKTKEQEANRFAACFLMPRNAVLGQGMAGSSIDRILKARTYWKVSAMALTHRLSELGLLSEWQYRSACIALAEQGYRSSEPGGIQQEVSQILRKVMFGTENKISVRMAAAELGIEPDEVRTYLRDLVPMVA